jgi:hypothetical protein
MTLLLTEKQRQAVRRGEPVRVRAQGLGELVVLRANIYDEKRKTKPGPAVKKRSKLSNARLKALATRHKPPQSWYDEDF